MRVCEIVGVCLPLGVAAGLASMVGAAQSRRGTALARLEAALRLGGGLDVVDDPSMAPILAEDAAATVRSAADALRTPVSTSHEAFRLAQRDLIPEGIAYDPVGKDFYVGSIYRLGARVGVAAAAGSRPSRSGRRAPVARVPERHCAVPRRAPAVRGSSRRHRRSGRGDRASIRSDVPRVADPDRHRRSPPRRPSVDCRAERPRAPAKRAFTPDNRILAFDKLQEPVVLRVPLDGGTAPSGNRTGVTSVSD